MSLHLCASIVQTAGVACLLAIAVVCKCLSGERRNAKTDYTLTALQCYYYYYYYCMFVQTMLSESWTANSTPPPPPLQLAHTLRERGEGGKPCSNTLPRRKVPVVFAANSDAAKPVAATRAAIADSSGGENGCEDNKRPPPRRRSRTASESDTVAASASLEEGGRPLSNEFDECSNERLRRHPSQAVMWYTTVPQSLVNQQLGSRHAPTRRSLRHSRMMVMARSASAAATEHCFNGDNESILSERSLQENLVLSTKNSFFMVTVPTKYLPPVIENYKLGTWLSCAQLFLGLAMTSLAVWFVAWAPHLAATEVTHYSGLAVCTSGWIGLLLMRCCRYHYPGTKQKGCVFPVKTYHIVVSVLASFFSSVCCLLSMVFHFLHVYNLYLAIPHCKEETLSVEETPPWLAELLELTRQERLSCSCSVVGDRDGGGEEEDATSRYPGLPCHDVKRLLPIVLTVSCALNFVSMCAAAWFGILVALSKRNKDLRAWRQDWKEGEEEGEEGEEEESQAPIISSAQETIKK